MSAPQVAQVNVALQRRIHQRRPTASSDGGFDDCQGQLGDSQAIAVDDVCA
jgi:hypothetical protein